MLTLCRGLPSVRSAISCAALMLPLPVAAALTINFAIVSAKVCSSLAFGFTLASSILSASDSVMDLGRPAGLPLSPFWKGFKFSRLRGFIPLFFLCLSVILFPIASTVIGHNVDYQS